MQNSLAPSSSAGVTTRSKTSKVQVSQQGNNNALDTTNSNNPTIDDLNSNDSGASTSSNCQGSTTPDVFVKPKLKRRGRPKKISQNPKDNDSVQIQPKKGKFSVVDDKSKANKQKNDAKDPDLAGSLQNPEEEEEVCPVCFDKPLHPLTLQCGHIYCFLCAKGLAESNLMSGGSCCLCRR